MPNGFILAGLDINSNDIYIRYSTDLSGSSYNDASIDIYDIVTNNPAILDSAQSNYIKLIRYNNNTWVALLTVRDSATNSNVLYSTNGGTNWQSINNVFLYSIDYGKIDNNTYGWLAIGYDTANSGSIVLYKYDIDFNILTVNNPIVLADIASSTGLVPEIYNDGYITDEYAQNVTISSNNNTYIITASDSGAGINGIFIYDSSYNEFTTSTQVINLHDSIQQDIIGNTYLYSTYDINNFHSRIYLKTLYSSGSWTLLINDEDNTNQTGRSMIGRIIMKSDILGSKWTITYASNNTFDYNTNPINVIFNDIAINGAGTIVAVGYSDINYPNNRADPNYRDGLIVYSTDNGATWTEVIEQQVYLFNKITYQNGYWIATTSNNKTPDQSTGSESATYITNDLTSWTTNTQGINISNWTPVFQTMNISAIQGGSFDLHCLLKGTSISTPNGYVPIENLVVGDKILMPCGEVKEITNVYVSHVFATDKTQPYIIPAGELGAIKDVYISPTHSVRASNGELIEAQFLGYKQANIQGIIEYYNISLGGNRNNMILADGVAVESMGKDLQKTVLDISSYPAARLFADNIRNSYIVKLHKQYNIPIKVLQGYPDSYIQELISK